MVGKSADRFGIVVTESAMNNHEQEVSNEEGGDKGLLLPPPFTQFNHRFQKRSLGRTIVPSSWLQGFKVY